MTPTTDPTNRPSIYPTLRYRDAEAAITFLTDVLGLTLKERHDGPDGTVAHAQLAWGNGLVMLSTAGVGDPIFDLGPVCLYLAVDDPDNHHGKAAAGGAEIVMGLVDQDYGSREYAARDPEGNVWCFGTYRPGIASE
jgi:uncharacterized glyoxalase superfamily protein PhnB